MTNSAFYTEECMWVRACAYVYVGAAMWLDKEIVLFTY